MRSASGRSHLISPNEVYTIYQQLPRIINEINMKTSDPHLQGRLLENSLIRTIDSLDYDCYRGISSRLVLEGISGVKHEHDLLFVKRFTSSPFYILEAKWSQIGRLVNRGEILVFNQKAYDVRAGSEFIGRPRVKLFRIFVSNNPLTKDAFRLCLTNGILSIQPCLDLSWDVPEARTRRPILLPPLDWAIEIVSQAHSKEIRSTYTLYLLKRLWAFRNIVFREVYSYPKWPIHRGNVLEKDFRQLVWEAKQIEIKIRGVNIGSYRS